MFFVNTDSTAVISVISNDVALLKLRANATAFALQDFDAYLTSFEENMNDLRGKTSILQGM